MLNELKNKLSRIELEETKLAEIITKDEINSDLLIILSNKASKLKSDKMNILAKIYYAQNQALDAKATINLSKRWKNVV